MSDLSIQAQNGVLVADSRLIAQELGIKHKNFLATIEKYNPIMASHHEIEPAAFQTRVVKRTQGGTYEEQWAWLTEPQATFIMTLSRNTEQVIKCKLALSVAFDKAKQIIQETIPAQAQELERLKLELELIRAKQRYQDSAQAVLASSSPAMLAYLRGDSLPPVRVEYRDRFIDTTTGKAIEHQDGCSLTKLIADAGLNPKSSILSPTC
jgi:phage regulator Rha-like protein